ncbi:MAG TPA: hypothetical protein VFQ54_10750 [Thermomicrobiales bacterium]|nr:hypothetical protein [Thermomicrobiales bacterium]
MSSIEEQPTTSTTIDESDSPTATSAALSEEEQRRRRSRAIAWGAGIFLAFGLGLPIWYALDDWRAGLITAIVVGGLTVVGYLKAGSDHAEQRAERQARMYSREDQDDEDDDGSYN